MDKCLDLQLLLALRESVDQPLRLHLGQCLSSLFFTSDNIDSGGRGFTAFKRNETINELNVC